MLAEIGLVKVGHLALDRTKLKANASKSESEELTAG